MRSVRPSRLSTAVVAPVAQRLLAIDLPALAADRRDEVVAFTCRRVDQLPDTTRLGVLCVASLYRLLDAMPAGRRAVVALARRPLPVLGEYPRLVRSLAVAYVWESWPDTHYDGGT